MSVDDEIAKARAVTRAERLPPGWVRECYACHRTVRVGEWCREPVHCDETATSGLCPECFRAAMLALETERSK